MQQINVALELFGIIVSILILICCFAEKLDSKQSKTFAGMLICNILVLTCDMVTWIFCGAEYTIILYICNFLVYSLGYVIVAEFSFYISEFFSVKTNFHKRVLNCIYISCILAILLVVVSLFNHMYFYFEDGQYYRGDWYVLSQIYPVVIIIINMIIVFYNIKVIGIHSTISLSSYAILPVIAMIIQMKVYGVTLLYLATTLSMMIIYITIQINQAKTLQKREAELIQADISIMLSQIQPHFIYNTLTSISVLCDMDPAKAKKATIDFSQYLRCNLDSLKRNTPIPFESELKHVKVYLNLEKMRFGENLNIVYRIKSKNFEIPALTLQPIVENAVKYGVCRKEDGGTVTIITYENRNNYTVVVKDDGVGYDPNEVQYDGRTHIGIDNVKSRLASMCGGTMEVNGEKGKGTCVIIRIPKGDVVNERISSR